MSKLFQTSQKRVPRLQDAHMCSQRCTKVLLPSHTTKKCFVLGYKKVQVGIQKSGDFGPKKGHLKKNLPSSDAVWYMEHQWNFFTLGSSSAEDPLRTKKKKENFIQLNFTEIFSKQVFVNTANASLFLKFHQF